jgi:uncharacterized phage-associated protein
MYDIDAICDYIIVRCEEGGLYLDLLKLQKLLYYCQAWSLAHDRGQLFKGKFQAWIHGPVSRRIYNRFIGRGMYTPITSADIICKPLTILPDDVALIASVLSVYGKFTGDQLEYLTHTETPWIEARRGVSPYERCVKHISEKTMRDFYRARLGY